MGAVCAGSQGCTTNLQPFAAEKPEKKKGPVSRCPQVQPGAGHQATAEDMRGNPEQSGCCGELVCGMAGLRSVEGEEGAGLGGAS